MIGTRIDLALTRWLGNLPVEQWALRCLLALAALASLVVTQLAAAAGLGAFWVVVVLLATMWAFASPDSAGPGVLIAALVVGWWTRVDDPVSWRLLVLAIGVLVVHATAALAAAGPPTARIRSDTLRRWAIAVATVALATVAAWLAYLILDQVSMQASTARLVVALVAVSLLASWIRASSIDASTDPSAVTRRDERP